MWWQTLSHLQSQKHLLSGPLQKLAAPNLGQVAENKVLNQSEFTDLGWLSQQFWSPCAAWAGGSCQNFLLLICVRLSSEKLYIKSVARNSLSWCRRKKKSNIEEVRDFGVDSVYMKHWFPSLICHILCSYKSTEAKESVSFAEEKEGWFPQKGLGLCWKLYGHTKRCFGAVLQWLIDHRISSTGKDVHSSKALLYLYIPKTLGLENGDLPWTHTMWISFQILSPWIKGG